jgi:rhodanese-related sulfurtransferase
VVTVCYLGMLSRTAAQHLVADGHTKVLNLDRGMKGWRELTGDGPEGA